MHEYSCDSGRRDWIYLVSLMMCAVISFVVIYVVDWAIGGVSIIIDFFLFIVSFGPLSFWVFFTNGLSGILLKLSGISDCSGVYKGELRTSYDDFKENHPITLTIVHKFREMGISLKTDNSESCSKTASIHQDGQKTVITYTFENTGSVNVGLNMHIGTCIITILNGDVKGMYYTHPDRGRYGEIIAHKEKIVK